MRILGCIVNLVVWGICVGLVAYLVGPSLGYPIFLIFVLGTVLFGALRFAKHLLHFRTDDLTDLLP